MIRRPPRSTLFPLHDALPIATYRASPWVSGGPSRLLVRPPGSSQWTPRSRNAVSASAGSAASLSTVSPRSGATGGGQVAPSHRRRHVFPRRVYSRNGARSLMATPLCCTYRSNSVMMVTNNADRSLSLSRRGNSGADRITRAGNPTARQFGGMVPDTTEFAPMTVPSPIVVPGLTETRQGSHTLLPSVTGSYDTGYPSN